MTSSSGSLSITANRRPAYSPPNRLQRRWSMWTANRSNSSPKKSGQPTGRASASTPMRSFTASDSFGHSSGTSTVKRTQFFWHGTEQVKKSEYGKNEEYLRQDGYHRSYRSPRPAAARFLFALILQPSASSKIVILPGLLHLLFCAIKTVSVTIRYHYGGKRGVQGGATTIAAVCRLWCGNAPPFFVFSCKKK